MEKKIYTKAISKEIAVAHVCEVGVFMPQISNVVDFILKDRIRATLVEPDPKCQAAIRAFFREYSNVTLLPYAICAAAWLRLNPGASRPKKMIAIAAFIYSLWALVGTGAQSLIWGAGLLLAGLLVYLFCLGKK